MSDCKMPKPKQFPVPEIASAAHQVLTGASRLFATVGVALLMSFTAYAQVNPKVMPLSGPLTKQTMSRLLLTDAMRVGNRIVAVGDRGYIVFSDNNGESWERAKSPAGLPLLNGLYFSDANTAWAVGHDAMILKSIDQGKTWESVFSTSKEKRPLMDIAFVDANTGFAVGAYGGYYETKDAGKTWAVRQAIAPAPKPAKPVKAAKGGRGQMMESDEDAEKSNDEDKHLNAIVKLGGNKLLIVGEAGTLLTSGDAGKTWTRLASPYKGSFFGAVQADDGSVLILGLRGNVFRAADASLKNWVQVETGTKASMMSGLKLADGAIVLSGLSGTMLISRDNGKSFSPLSTGTIKPLAAAAAGAANKLIVVGETGPREVALAPAVAEAKKSSK
jgi:photosystem II stability/assembly factor-like uncharacterized protein